MQTLPCDVIRFTVPSGGVQYFPRHTRAAFPQSGHAVIIYLTDGVFKDTLNISQVYIE